MKSWDVVGYHYNGDALCTDCARREAARHTAANGVRVHSVSAEVELDEWARIAGIDRWDESTFDTDDFPKIVFASQANRSDVCGTCLENLLS